MPVTSRLLAVDEEPPPAGAALKAVAAVPADPGAIAGLPRRHVRAHRVDAPGDLVAWDAGQGETREGAGLYEGIAVTDAARLDLDADLSGAWLGDFALDQLEHAPGFGHLDGLHLRHGLLLWLRISVPSWEYSECGRGPSSGPAESLRGSDCGRRLRRRGCRGYRRWRRHCGGRTTPGRSASHRGPWPTGRLRPSGLGRGLRARRRLWTGALRGGRPLDARSPLRAALRTRTTRSALLRFRHELARFLAPAAGAAHSHDRSFEPAALRLDFPQLPLELLAAACEPLPLLPQPAKLVAFRVFVLGHGALLSREAILGPESVSTPAWPLLEGVADSCMRAADIGRHWVVRGDSARRRCYLTVSMVRSLLEEQPLGQGEASG